MIGVTVLVLRTVALRNLSIMSGSGSEAGREHEWPLGCLALYAAYLMQISLER